MKYRLGKRPARHGAVRFKLRDYVDLSQLPTPPAEWGHESLITDWKMLSNDSVGDCVIAGGCHETMLWQSEASMTVPFDDATAIANYSAITGYDPSNPDSDQGTDMQVAAEYRRTTGLLDANGNRHKILAYLALEPGNLDELYVAAYLFGGCGVGIRFPDTAEEQFEQQQPWDVDPQSQTWQIQGGHYVPVLSRRGGNLLCVTWGAIQQMTPRFYQTLSDEALVYLTDEDLKDGKTLEGFSLDDLTLDLSRLKSNPLPSK